MKAQIVKINPKTIVIKSENGKFATVNKSEIDFEYKLGDVLIMEKNGDEIYYLPKSAANFQAAADFWGTSNAVDDREQEIEQAENKHKLSKNKKTQDAINQVMGFGFLLEWCGILSAFVTILSLFAWNVIGLSMLILIIEIIFIIMGENIRKLSYTPATIKVMAVIALIIGGLILKIDAIILLTKIKRYEEWYFGETD